MINVDRPYHQWAVDDMQALLAARYDAVVQRLLYPEPGNQAFTTTIHEAANDAEFVTKEDDGEYFMVECRSPKPFFNLKRTLHTLKIQESDVCEDMPPSSTSNRAAVDLEMVTQVNHNFGVFQGLAQLQWLVCFGIIGARNKPRVEDVQAVMRQEVSDAQPGAMAFRRAVRALTARAIDPGEEATLSRSIDKFEWQLEHPVHKEGARAKINRYYQGIVARRVLAALLHPFTTAQHLQDELDVIHNKVEPAYAPHVPQPDGSIPTITLPWPILPPSQRQSSTEPQKSERAPRGGESGHKRMLDPLRTRWLGSVAARWPYGAKCAKVELHNKIVETVAKRSSKIGDLSRYRAAVLKGPDGKVFAVIADSTIAFPANAMYVGIVRQLRNEQGQAVSWRRVFKSTKEEARKLGAHQFHHTKQDVHQRALDYVCEVFEEQYGFPPAFRRPASGAA